MSVMVLLVAFHLFVIAVTMYFGIAHLRDLARINAAMQVVGVRKVLRRRLLLLGATTLPLFAFLVLVPDPWSGKVDIEILDPGVELASWDAAALARTPHDKWRPATTRDLKFILIGGRQHRVLRVRIPPRPNTDPYVAELAYPFLARLDFLLVEGDVEIKRGSSGLDRPFSFAMHRGLYYSFDVPTDASAERMLYVGTESNGLTNLTIQLMDERTFQLATTFRALVMALTIGAFLGIMLYNLAMSLSVRDKVYVYYLVYQCLLAVFMLTYTGMVETLIPILGHENFQIRAYLNYLLILLMVASLGEFYCRFIAVKDNFPWASRGMRFLTWVALALVVPSMFLDLGSAGLLALPFLAIAITAGIAFMLPIINYRYVFYTGISLVGLGVSTILHVAGIFGLLPDNFVLEFLYGFGGVWEAIFLSLAIGDKISMMREQRNSIASALEDGGSLSRVNQVVGRSFSRNYVPREWNVSVVFINIADFSRFTERMAVPELYPLLSREMREIGRIVKEHHGSIDRSLGDGLLCYFGYERPGAPSQHARDAYQAARRIQERSIAQVLDGDAAATIVFPLSIGINAANVLVANLSSERENDFTMIGSGVNLASRLNAVCSPFRIIVSEEFKALLDKGGEQVEDLNEIFVSIKHHQDLLRAFECNPFKKVPGRLAKAERAYLDLMGYSRKEGRFRIKGKVTLELRSPRGSFSLTDFSLDGLGMAGPLLISHKTVLELEFMCKDAWVLAPLRTQLLHKVQAEVRWCRTNGDRFEHGLRFIGLNAAHKEIIFEFLNSLFTRTNLDQLPGRGGDGDPYDSVA